jgi:hypothetical protein
MSCCIRVEYGARRMFITNHIVPSEIRARVIRFLPRRTRSTTASTNGKMAVATRACGLSSSSRLSTNQESTVYVTAPVKISSVRVEVLTQWPIGTIRPGAGAG